MAQRTVVQLTDDITGDPIKDGEGRTVKFAVEGVEYELDLSDKNAKKFDDSLSFYTSHARRTGGRATRGSSSGRSRTSATGVDSQAVRKWAASNGIKLSDRGRIPADVLKQYKDAGN